MRLFTAVLLSIWFVGAAFAQPVTSERVAAMVEELLDAGADGSALAELADVSAPSDIMETLGAERAEMLQSAWSRAFAVELLRADVARYVAQREAASSVSSALAWLQRPDVSRATARMRQATGRDFDLAFGQWIASLSEQDLDMERLEHIILISHRSGEDRVGEVVLGLAEASIRGAHAVSARGDRPDLNAAMDRLRELGPTLTAQAIVQNQLYLYYVLSDLSVPELSAYADALDLPDGRWYVNTMGDAMANAIGNATQRLMTEAAG